jgi:hypothetical protein
MLELVLVHALRGGIGLRAPVPTHARPRSPSPPPSPRRHHQPHAPLPAASRASRHHLAPTRSTRPLPSRSATTSRDEILPASARAVRPAVTPRGPHGGYPRGPCCRQSLCGPGGYDTRGPRSWIARSHRRCEMKHGEPAARWGDRGAERGAKEEREDSGRVARMGARRATRARRGPGPGRRRCAAAR